MVFNSTMRSNKCCGLNHKTTIIHIDLKRHKTRKRGSGGRKRNNKYAWTDIQLVACKI